MRKISLFNLAVNTLVVLMLEIIQLIKGKSATRLFLDLFFFALIFLLTSNSLWTNMIALIWVIVFQSIETGSWLYTNSSINFQVLSSMDIQWIWNDHKELLLVFPVLFLIILVLFTIEYKFRLLKQMEMSSNIIMFTALFDVVLLFDFSTNIYHSLYPFSKISQSMLDERSYLSSYFKTKSVVITLPNKIKKRNIIFFQMESFEKQSMGTYNKYYPDLMPFVSNLSGKGTFISNMISQPYTTWTSGSIFATHCGMPHVVTDMTWSVLKWTSQTSDWPNITCFPDYLHKVGYNQFAVASGDLGIMKIREFFQKHHLKIIDNTVHHKRKDWNTIDYMISDIFPMLENSQPFYMYYINDDTHPFFYVDNRCKNRINASKMLNSFDCFDQIFERFVKAFKNSTFFKNTLFIVLGDHLMIGDFNGVYENPRKLAMFMPYEEKKEISKKTSLYDVAPTIMDMLGIKYWPNFPFGTNLNSDIIGKYPNINDFSIIYDIMHNIINTKSSQIKCFGKEGFCDDTNSYINDRKHLLQMKR